MYPVDDSRPKRVEFVPSPATPDVLTAYLQHLHRKDGYPTCRAMAAATGISRAGVNDYLRGAAPGAHWDRIATLVRYLHGDEAKARTLWEQTHGQRKRSRVGRRTTITTTQLAAIMDALAETRDELRALRRIQGVRVATEEQITRAAAYAVREYGPMTGGREDSGAARVAIEAIRHLLNQLGIPVWNDMTSRRVAESGSPAGGELTRE